MTTDTTDEHTDEPFGLLPGDEATFVLDDGTEVRVEVESRDKHHDESGPHITEQTVLRLRRTSDGASLRMSRTNGLSGLADADPFPSYIPLYETADVEPGKRVPDENILGYVDSVEDVTTET